jgi:hypothetical protein
MSKKVKKTAKKAAKKATKKKAGKTAAPRKSALLASLPPDPVNRAAVATIFVYDTAEGVRVRTSPQLLSCPPGYVEWTVVNLTSGPMPDVDITWHKGSPWGGSMIPIRGGNERRSLLGGKQGRFKYNVTCKGYTEDPELEYPPV